MTKLCHEKPNQYINIDTLSSKLNSLEDKSAGDLKVKALEKPNSAFIHDLKKNVGPNRYKNTSRKTDRTGNKSTKNEKNRNSETKKIEPGKPKNISKFNRETKNNLGQIKFTPLISVSRRVLNRLAIASTRRKELVDRRA